MLYKEITSNKTITLEADGGSLEVILDYFIGFKNNEDNSIENNLMNGLDTYGDPEIDNSVSWITNIELLPVDDTALEMNIDYERNEGDTRTANLKLENANSAYYLILSQPGNKLEIESGLELFTLYFTLYGLTNANYNSGYYKKFLRSYRVSSTYGETINTMYKDFVDLKNNVNFLENTSDVTLYANMTTSVNGNVVYCPQITDNNNSNFVFDFSGLSNSDGGFLSVFEYFNIDNTTTYMNSIIKLPTSTSNGNTPQMQISQKFYINPNIKQDIIIEFETSHPEGKIVYMSITIDRIKDEFEQIIDFNFTNTSSFNRDITLSEYTKMMLVYIPEVCDVGATSPYITLMYKCEVHDSKITAIIPINMIDYPGTDIKVDHKFNINSICISTCKHDIWNTEYYGNINII